MQFSTGKKILPPEMLFGKFAPDGWKTSGQSLSSRNGWVLENGGGFCTNCWFLQYSQVREAN